MRRAIGLLVAAMFAATTGSRSGLNRRTGYLSKISSKPVLMHISEEKLMVVSRIATLFFALSILISPALFELTEEPDLVSV